ncbi:MAG: radical SAM protein, partial [Candidatus Omnitrophica bacterium]|nr:radical SAM protein [Candidatus Omnitrophota bacterium]
MDSVFTRFLSECESKHRLIRVSLSLTNKCNLKCRYCYVVPEDKKELSLKEIKNIIDQMFKLKVIFLTFTGGEMFTREDIFEIINYAAGKEMCITLLTNGTYIDKNVARFIKSRQVDVVYLPIYGTSSKIHDFFTQRNGSFDKVISSIKYLQEEKQDFRINYSL